MNDIAKARLEKAFSENPPGDLTDRCDVRRMCTQMSESAGPVIKGIDCQRKESWAQAFTKIIG